MLFVFWAVWAFRFFQLHKIVIGFYHASPHVRTPPKGKTLHTVLNTKHAGNILWVLLWVPGYQNLVVLVILEYNSRVHTCTVLRGVVIEECFVVNNPNFPDFFILKEAC